MLMAGRVRASAIAEITEAELRDALQIVCAVYTRIELLVESRHGRAFLFILPILDLR